MTDADADADADADGALGPGTAVSAPRPIVPARLLGTDKPDDGMRGARPPRAAGPGRAGATAEDDGRPLLYRYCTYDGAGWSDWGRVFRDGRGDGDGDGDGDSAAPLPLPLPLPIPPGRGSLRVYPDLVPAAERGRVTTELAACGFFRAYGIQGTTEPRRHFLAHADAVARAAPGPATRGAAARTAFDDPEVPQPGYRYNGRHTTLKARPLAALPHLAALSGAVWRATGGAGAAGDDAEGGDLDATTAQWTIGVNPVCYRSATDGIAAHADDDQGETLIVAAVVQQEDDGLEVGHDGTAGDEDQDQVGAARAAGGGAAAPRPARRAPRNLRRRVVVVQPRQNTLAAGDVYAELFLRAGDAYAMDGVLQEHYLHAIPKLTGRSRAAESGKRGLRGETTNEERTGEAVSDWCHRRLVVVFRRGEPHWVTQDSGESSDWTPKPPPPPLSFGRCLAVTPSTDSEGRGTALEEGGVYTKRELYDLGAHVALQKGVSGNMREGCNAIAVSGLRLDGKGEDDFRHLLYFVEHSTGGGAMRASAQRGLPVRVFRSSDLKNAFRAPQPADMRQGKKLGKVFRYDGLYRITRFGHDSVESGLQWQSCFQSTTITLRGRDLCCFELHRIENGNDRLQNQLFCQRNGKTANLTLPGMGDPISTLRKVPTHDPAPLPPSRNLRPDQFAACSPEAPTRKHRVLTTRTHQRSHEAAARPGEEVVASTKAAKRRRVEDPCPCAPIKGRGRCIRGR